MPNDRHISNTHRAGRQVFDSWSPEVQDAYRQSERAIKEANLTSQRYYDRIRQLALRGQSITPEEVAQLREAARAKAAPLIEAQQRRAALVNDGLAYRAAHGPLTSRASWLGILRDRNTTVGASLAGLSALAGYGLAKLQNNLSYQPPEYDEVNMDYGNEYLGERGD